MSVLLASVILSFFNASLPKITKWVGSCFVPQYNRSALKQEIEQIVAELKTISMRQEFPKYARLERKLNKLKDERKESERAYRTDLDSAVIKISYIAQGLLTLASLVMFWLYRSHRVAALPQTWLFPLGHLLSWPLLSPGDLSFPVWFLITNTVFKLLHKAYIT